jgi:transcriptional regulator with XRE-family HTH domain
MVGTAASRAQAAAPGAVPDAGAAGAGVSAAAGRKGFKAELDDLRERMRGLGFGYDEIAAEIARRHRVRPRQSYRLARGWTLNHAAERFNALAARQGADPQARAGMTGAHLCEYEQWPASERKPSVHVLLALARLYDTDALCLLDLADHESLAPKDRLALIRPQQPPAALAEPAARKETGPRGHAARAEALGLSLSLPFAPGRLVIEISGPAADAGQDRAEPAGGQLALVRDLPGRARQASRR